MTVARRQVTFRATLEQAEALWYDVDRWPSWVDGLGSVVECRGAWPDVGGSVTWDSTPYGRGRVVERVREFRPASGQTVHVEDERLRGVQRVSFAAVDELVEVTLELDYALTDQRPASRVVDLLFIRRAFGDSLRRTLESFGRELGG